MRDVDHIIPKAAGGTDDDDNLESLCGDCHDAKSAAEAKAAQHGLHAEGMRRTGPDGWPIEPKRWGYSIPHGMRPAAIPVAVVVGPPAGGKTTYVQAHAGKRDKVIDLDAIMVRIGGTAYDPRPAIVAKAMRYREMMIRGLADMTAGQAWLIVTAPTKAERAAWLDALGPMARLVTVDAPPEECERRIHADPARRAVAPQLVKVARAWER